MVSSFLHKSIVVDVDERTWPEKSVPTQLKGASGIHTIDVGGALHMLGTLTMPNILSPASPALFWAWLRYFLAPAPSSELRITMDFSDLDPHQKGVLSDDFGVAIATKWMLDRFGAFTHIVDGRRFANQFTHLLRKKRKSKAKVGMSKAPDFVMRDATGKWHVLECKGTQTSRDYQRRVLATAMVQKRALQLVGSIRGEQLASSLYIANEQDKTSSHLKVVDPDNEEPLIRLTGQHAGEMEEKANRLAIAQALGSIGLNEIAVEMTLPPNIDEPNELLLPSELYRLRSPREGRVASAKEQVRARNLNQFMHRHHRYEGRDVEFDLPPRGIHFRFRKARLRQGVSADLLTELAATDGLQEDNVDSQIKPYTAEAGIVLQTRDRQTSLAFGDVFYSELTWS
jgi:hypothetical protein